MFELTFHYHDSTQVIARFTSEEKAISYMEENGYTRNKIKKIGSQSIYQLAYKVYYQILIIGDRPVDPVFNPNKRLVCQPDYYTK